MIRIAICDDSPEDLLVTYLHVNKYIETHGLDATITKFLHPDELATAIEKTTFELYILDILMPMMNGIETGQLIRKRDMSGKIVYLTSDAEYALESFSTYPFNYLLKPVRKEELYSMLDAFCENLDGVCERLEIKTKDGIRSIRLGQISYMEYLNHSALIHMTDGKTIRSTTMSESFTSYAEPLVNSGRFVRPHASYIVNLNHVRTMGKSDIEMEDGSIIQISRNRVAEVRAQYARFQKDL